jgi:DNA topoisomerase-1
MSKKSARVKSPAASKPRRGKPLLIVESPTKARTITRLLGEKFQVLSSRGHVFDLPKSQLGVDIEHDFEPKYIRIRGKEETIRELKEAASHAREVYLGTDPDREGEAIAFFIAQAIDGNAARRVRFHEITKPGLDKAFAAKTEIDRNMVDSQKARRILDRLVGYLTSPLLWRVFASGNLSAGRVQSVALRLICEREREILAFKPEEYWLIEVDLKTRDNQQFAARLVKCEGEDCRIGSGTEAAAVQRKLEGGAEFRIAQVKPATRRRSPSAPFITSTLQQDAARSLRFTARRTMRIAQQLFEGIALGSETVGLITYPRTDSVRVAAELVQAAREQIARQFGPEYVPEKPRFYKERKGSQGAHEAVRPTSLARTPESVEPHLTPEQFRLYDLIYRRFLASQMADAVYQSTLVLVKAGEYLFQASALKREFAGFERVYGDAEKEKSLPPLEEGDKVELVKVRPEQHFTLPPPRYSEAALIKKLEVNGIGRPSTYASIVATLDEREYLERRQGKLFPTELGLKVNDLLIPRFDNIFEVGFTREMERELDLVEEGKEQWQAVVRRFYAPFKTDLDKAEKEFEEFCPKCGKPLALKRGKFGRFLACSGYPECEHIKREEREEKTMDEKCPECGKPLIEREGKFGKFVACSGYPECKHIKRDPGAEPELLEEKCPECGKPLARKQGRFGPFTGCTGYPACKYIKREAPPAAPDGQKCPQCGKPLVQKQGRFGAFLGCSGYPECKYIQKRGKVEPKLLEEKCPECGKPLQERSGRFGPMVGCSGYPACKYVKSSKPKEPAKTVGTCPECGKPLVERNGKYGPFVSCSGYPKCKYRPGKDKSEPEV